MSFSSLPTQLVRQIIESNVPSEFDIYTSNERQSTLRSFCLISRRFRQIAQPVLFEVVRLNSFRVMDTVLDIIERKQWKHVLREVFIERTSSPLHAADALNGLGHHGQGVRALVLYQPQKHALDLGSLQLLPNLTSLNLGGEGYFCSEPFVLAKVETLELTRIDFQFACSILDLKVIPALRRLGLVEASFNLDSLSNSPFVELLSQLEALFLESDPIRPIPAYLLPALDRIRFACWLDEDDQDDSFAYLLRLGVQHIKLIGLIERIEELAVEELSSLTAKIQTVTQLRPRSLCLENRPWHSARSRDPAGEEERVGAVRAFKRLCKEKEVLFYHETGRKFIFEPYISEGFTEIVEVFRRKDQKERDVGTRDATA